MGPLVYFSVLTHHHFFLNRFYKFDMSDEKPSFAMEPIMAESYEEGVKDDAASEGFEVFKKTEGAVDFRTVGWVHTAMIFVKSEY